jgi:NADH dehydrogenase/NADH:ubiquinone oxidoreductase subunit G
MAVGAVAGGVAGKIAKHHDEKKIASSLDEGDWLPANSSAIVAVVDDQYLDKIDAAVEHAAKKVNKAIDKGDYDAVVKAVNEGGEKIVDAVDS